MSALRILALSYLALASAFVVAATLVAHPMAGGDIAAAARGMAALMDHTVTQPQDTSPVARLILSPPVAAPHRVQAPDDRLVSDSVSITILPDLTPSLPQPVPRVDTDVARNAGPAFQIPEPPQEQAPVVNRASAAALRLKAGLTPEMAQNFDLFLYVSKAEHGPLAQRLYVFSRQRDGELRLLHDWAASTGRERSEISPAGQRSFTATPRGYYQLDPQRMYRSYHSNSWDQDMPNAMFFNWEREGQQTGLAIHAALSEDIAKLGSRASAGCVHLAPENAATLYDLVRADYRGPVPRFAYNSETRTVSNRGAFMHDRAGNLKMADGYRVLVMIEDYGGESVVASLF